MQPDALHNVFRLVHDQCTALTLDEIESPKTARFFDLMLKRLEEDRILSRDENYLPSSEELVARAGTARPGLFGPELAECISGSKRWVKSVLLRNGNPTLSDGGVDQLFVESFPERLLEKGKDGITTFPLIKEQTATQLSNALIDSLGTTFLFQLAAKHGPAQPEKPIHAATAAELTLDVRHLRNEVRQSLWGDLEDSPTMEGYQHYISAMQDIRKAHQSLTTWMLSNYSKPEDLSRLQQTYQSVWAQAAENPLAVVPENQREEVQRKITAYVSAGLDQTAANKLALAGSISSVFEMAKHVAEEGEPLAQVANRYWPIVRETGVGRVLELTTLLNTNEPNRDNSMGDDLRYIRKAVARIATSLGDQNPADLGSTLASKPEYSNLSGAIDTFGRMVLSAQHDDRLVADALLALHTVRERVEDVAKALARKGLPN